MAERSAMPAGPAPKGSEAVAGATVEALLFDLGNVVLGIDFGRALARWAEHAGCDPEAFRGLQVTGEAYEQHERGQISDQVYFAHLRSQMAVDLTDAQVLDGWINVFLGALPGIAELLKRARAKVPIYAFTNSNVAHEAVWSKRYADVLGLFETVFNSSTIGLRKPEPAAFAYVVDAIGVPASHILFFDDLAANIEGARRAGLQTAHVTEPNSVAETLETLWPTRKRRSSLLRH